MLSSVMVRSQGEQCLSLGFRYWLSRAPHRAQGERGVMRGVCGVGCAWGERFSEGLSHGGRGGLTFAKVGTPIGVTFPPFHFLALLCGE